MLVADLLRARGFSASTTLEAGNLGSTDRQQLQYAVAHQKTMLTHNRADFEKLAQDYFASDSRHSGIIIAVRRSPKEITGRLLPILNSTTRDEVENQLLYI